MQVELRNEIIEEESVSSYFGRRATFPENIRAL